MHRKRAVSGLPFRSSCDSEKTLNVCGLTPHVRKEWGSRAWKRSSVMSHRTFLPNSQGELFPEPEVVGRDMQQMAAAGVNTVRTYMAPPAWFLDLAHQQ